MSYLTILVGDQPSTKHYTIDPITDEAKKGKVKTSYYHDSYTVPVSNLADLYEALATVRENPNAFIIRGRGKEDFQTQVRRTKEEPANFHEEPTQWVCFDFDEFHIHAVEMESQGYKVDGQVHPSKFSRQGLEDLVKTVVSFLPYWFHEVTYIYQWSSSAGLTYKDKPVKDGVNLHLFFWLDRAINDQELKAWLGKDEHPLWDISIFRTVTPIFVGSHIVRDPRIEDHIPDDCKFGIIEKEWDDEVEVPEIEVPVLENFILDSMAMPEDTTNEIMQQLYTLGAIYKSSGQWFKLKHPKEKTPGDWHIAKTNPKVAHHHTHKSKRIDHWIKDFYGVDPTFKLPNRDNESATEYYALQKKLKEKYGV